MTTQATTKDQTPVTTLTVIEGKLFPRIPAFARKIYFSPETIFFNIPESVLKIVDIKDNEKIEGEFFNTVNVFMTIDGVVHENVLMPAVWNIQQSKELTAEQRAGYMYNEELGAFAFLRSGKIQMLPVNGRTVVDAEGNSLFDLDEILSDIESLITVNKQPVQQSNSEQQANLNLAEADWKNTENFVEVLLAKLIGPIGNTYSTSDYRLDQENEILVIHDFTIDFDSKEPLFAVITEHMHLQKISNVLNENFAVMPGIGHINVYDLYGGISIIFTPGFTALISTQLAKQLQAKKDERELNTKTDDIHTVQNPNVFMLGNWTVYALKGGSLRIERDTRTIWKDGRFVVGLEPTEKMLSTTANELRSVGLATEGNVIVSNGDIAHLYDVQSGLVHSNTTALLNTMLSNIGIGVNLCGYISAGKFDFCNDGRGEALSRLGQAEAEWNGHTSHTANSSSYEQQREHARQFNARMNAHWSITPDQFKGSDWAVSALLAPDLRLDRASRTLMRGTIPLVGLDSGEILLETSRAELKNVGIDVFMGTILIHNAVSAYLYDLNSNLVHANSAVALLEMLRNVGILTQQTGRIANDAFSRVNSYYGYEQMRGTLWMPNGQPNTQMQWPYGDNTTLWQPLGNLLNSAARHHQPNQYGQNACLGGCSQTQWPYSETAGTSMWFNPGDAPEMNFGQLAQKSGQRKLFDAPTDLPPVSGMYSQPTFGSDNDDSDVMSVDDIVKSIVLTDLTNDDIKTIMAALITKM